MLRDDRPVFCVFISNHDYHYSWEKAYFYSPEDFNTPVNLYPIKETDCILSLIIPKCVVKGHPYDDSYEFFEDPGDPDTLISIPMPKWVDYLMVE